MAAGTNMPRTAKHKNGQSGEKQLGPYKYSNPDTVLHQR